MVNASDLSIDNNTQQDLDERLLQIFVQVWNKSKAQGDKRWLVKALIDTICILEKEEVSAQQLNSVLSFGEIKDLKRKILIPLINIDYGTMTNPDKPTSSKQKYKLTTNGRELFR